MTDIYGEDGSFGRHILLVCLGNICRSPIAEGVLRNAVAARGLDWTVDSAGTGDWHVGCPPDPRAQAAASRAGIDISALRGRQVTLEDFNQFDDLIALDRNNLRDLRAMAPAQCRARISLLLDHAPGREGEDVADPYYGEDAGFDACLRDVAEGVRGLVREVEL